MNPLNREKIYEAEVAARAHIIAEVERIELELKQQGSHMTFNWSVNHELDPSPTVGDVTVRITGEPSKSKKGGPNWIAVVTDSDNPTYHYGSFSGETFIFPIGETVRLQAKTVQRKSRGGVHPAEISMIECVVTGDPVDMVKIEARAAQSLTGYAIGLRKTH